ncbi:hypothetical protein Bca52824_049901 [Brassica carinata]|uniref:MATH domain-containing protein n=1 Tax=Brassica carinata TaxID=52824 RepID=A0A8X7UTH9_BRACI|nr:hypothetical protein Bca52824_049901 [Brassica carinata]
MWDQKPSFTLEIGNFSNKEAVIASNVFEAGGCEWYLSVHPKGVSGRFNGHLCLFLTVANRKSLRTGWQRSVKFCFLVLNESNKELYRSPVEKASSLFCAWNPTWGIRKILPLSMFQEKGFLEKDVLIIEVYIKVVEAFDGEDGDFDGEGGDITGFQVFADYVASVKKIFEEQVLKTDYKNALSKACSKLSELVEVGFKLDWLKSKFDELSFKRKNADGVDDESLVQQLDERIKNLELMVSGFEKDCLKSKIEESIKNPELVELGVKLDSLKSKLEEVSLEKKKSYDADESLVQQQEERIKNLELMERVKDLEVMKVGSKLDCLNTKIEENVKNTELMVSCIKVELDKKKDKSTAEGFLFCKSNMWDQNPSLRFEIDNFSNKEAAIASKIFVAGRCEWYLRVHPKGHNLIACLCTSTLQIGGKKSTVFCASNPGWGVSKTLPLSNFQEQGFLKNNKLIIEVYIQVVEAFDGEGGDINGFQVFAAHVASVKKTFAEHVAKTEYKNTLSNACSKLSELAEVGVKLDWLKSKFDEVSFKRKNADGAADDESMFQQLEERIKNLELMGSGFKKDCLKSKSKRFKLDCVNTKLDNADESRVQQLEERVKDMSRKVGFKLDCLNTTIEERSLERKKSDDAPFQQLEESVKNIELMVSCLKVELDKKKDKSTAEGFLLVD